MKLSCHLRYNHLWGIGEREIKTSMDTWQITQLFLSDTGVHEVSINLSSHKLRCDCPGYTTRSACKHVNFVREKMDENGGIYPTEVSNRVSRIETIIASKSPESFRTLLINFGKIEVV